MLRVKAVSIQFDGFYGEVFMIEITGVPTYPHAVQASFRFDFGTVRLSAVFFDEVVYVRLPDDRDLLWKIVKVEKELKDFLCTLRKDTKRLQFIINYGTTATGGGKHVNGLDLNIIHITLDNPTSELPQQELVPHPLPFGVDGVC